MSLLVVSFSLLRATQPVSPADEVKSMVIRRMSQKYWEHQDEKKKERMAEMEAAEKSRTSNKGNDILDLQRRVEGMFFRYILEPSDAEIFVYTDIELHILPYIFAVLAKKNGCIRIYWIRCCLF